MTISCDKEDGPGLDDDIDQSEVSEERLLQIRNLGYSDVGVYTIESDIHGTGYVVENDIILYERDFQNTEDGLDIRIAEVEQYRTTLVPEFRPRRPRGSTTLQAEQIVILMEAGFPNDYWRGLRRAVDRYNRANLAFRISPVLAGTPEGNDALTRRNRNGRRGPDITIRNGSNFASAGFPVRVQRPGRRGSTPTFRIEIYDEILVNPTAINSNNEFHIGTIIAHEIGHCIGFRHTDFFNRSLSCGFGGNEGQGDDGAIHIPGTPTGTDSNSFMQACIGRNEDRPFTANDLTALRFLHDIN